MPNYCEFQMRVKGLPEAIHVLESVVTDYEHPRHFWRVFDFNEFERHTAEDGRAVVSYCGNCAWSVYCCMCSGAHTYAEDHPEESTSLQEISEFLGLEIEVFSWEPGMGFSEHFLYRAGEEAVNACIDYSEYLLWEDEELDVAAIRQQAEDRDEFFLEGEGVLRVGGFAYPPQWDF